MHPTTLCPWMSHALSFPWMAVQEVIQAHRDRMDAADLIAAHHAACACMLGDSNSPLAAWADNWQRGGIHQRRLHNQPKQPTSSQLPLQLASQLADLASSHAPHMAFDDLYCLVQAQRDVLEAVQARCGQPGFMPMHRDSHGSSSASHVSQGSHGQQHMHQGLPESPQHALLQLAHASLSACLPSPTAALHLGVEEVRVQESGRCVTGPEGPGLNYDDPPFPCLA